MPDKRLQNERILNFDMDKFADKIAEEEGFRSKPYICTEGKLTLGYGFNLDVIEMPEMVAKLWLKILIKERYKAMLNYDWFLNMPVEKSIAVIDMTYQMGIEGVLLFRNMIDKIEQHRWHEAATELLDSKYARQTPERANRNAEILRGNV